ncbi:hypothetical protein D9M71_826790 [compost metagenome]
MCTEGGHYFLQTLDNLFFYFGEVPDDDSRVPLQRIENALGHFLHFTRTGQPHPAVAGSGVSLRSLGQPDREALGARQAAEFQLRL